MKSISMIKHMCSSKNVLRVYDTIVKDLQKNKLFVMEKIFTKYTAHPRGQGN